MSGEFHDKVVLVTGGARGIGYASAKMMARQGASLVLVDLDATRVNAAAAALASETGARVIGIKADISLENEVRAMADASINQVGPVDIFVSSAAILDDKLFLQSQPSDWTRMLDVCLFGPMLCLRALLPVMVDQHYGRVICLASDSARMGQARLSYYAAAKAGLIALMKSVAQEVGSSGITLNVVSPGATNTELRQAREASLKEQMGDERYSRRVKSVLKMYPLGRLGEPEDVAALVTFLASDQAAWITGQVLSVNGGFSMV